MELFLIYLVTRLTDLKDGLHSIEICAGLLVAAAVVARLVNEFFTDAAIKDKVAAGHTDNKDAYYYLGVQRTSKHGLKLFLPVFVVAFVLNLFLPTTRDAVVIAGGYGLVEAVKNERVQRLFTKSTNVASQWLDEQLNGDDKENAKKTQDKPAETATAKSTDPASTEAVAAKK
jgi:hypothetical protein